MSWTLYHRHVKLLDQFHQCCLQCILDIKWYNRVSNVKVLLQAQVQSIDALLTHCQLRWFGHLVHMQDNRLPKQLFYGELTEDHQPRRWPKLCYKDTLTFSPEREHLWRTLGNNGQKQVWMEACYVQGNRSLWKQKTKQSSCEACSNEGQNHHCRALH